MTLDQLKTIASIVGPALGLGTIVYRAGVKEGEHSIAVELRVHTTEAREQFRALNEKLNLVLKHERQHHDP